MENEILALGSFSRLVKSRYSCRSFDGKGLRQDEINLLGRFCREVNTPFPAPLRLEIIHEHGRQGRKMFGAGTYGLIRGARCFIAGIVDPRNPDCWANLGYGMQAVVLRATAMDLQTCWIGGVFDRRAFRRLLEITPGENVPAVVAVGRAAARRTLRDRLVRKAARGDSRKAPGELFFYREPGMPLPPLLAERFGSVLEFVRLAPSASNKQPWRFFVEENSLHLYLNRDRFYSRLIPSVDLQKIDLGIAMLHLSLAAREASLEGEWRSLSSGLPAIAADFEYLATYCLFD